MLKNLIQTAWRSLLKNRFFSILNILGLSISLAVFLLISLYVYFENSYENFVPDADNIYRLRLDMYQNNELLSASAEIYPGVGPAMKAELPEVTGFARLYNLGYKNNVVITYEDAKPQPIAFKHRKFLYADSSFLPMMHYRMKEGDASTALSTPFSAVITESFAKRYFGNDAAIGKMLRMQDDDYNNELVTVTGVVEDLPANTHLKFDVLFSYKTLFARRPDLGEKWAVGRYDQSWQRKDMYTFIQLREGSNRAETENKLTALIDKFNPSLKERNRKDIITLQPLRSIHLTSSLAEEPETNGDQRIVEFIGIIGIFTLLIGWVNYINLATSRSLDRAREVGVRKVMGALRNQLVNQFLVEAAVINLFSLLIALLVAFIALPYFNTLAGLQLSLSSLLQPWFLLLLLVIFAIGTLLSGFYPALVLSGFQPVSVLKGKLKNSKNGLLLRKALVVFQFTASIGLVAGTIIVYDQMSFLMKQDIGVNIDQVLVIERPGIAPRDRQAYNSSVDVFRNELSKDPQIEGVTCSVTIPGKQREFKAQIAKYGAPREESISVRVNSMDYNFISVYGMKLIAGRNFSKDYTNDPDTSVVITQTASQQLGFKNPEEAIGQTISIPGFQWNPIVVGVVNDYHQVSLKKALEPTVFYCAPNGDEFFSIRVNTAQLPQTLATIQDAWTKAFPGNPFEYFFLDDYFNQQYSNERKFGTLFSTFASFALIVGCIGLFGLSAYTTLQRTKEIGLRKVLGSSEQSIFSLLSVSYVKLIGISLALAVPAVWWVMQQWLNGFTYKTEISIGIFALAGALVLLISLATVSFQTIRAARINPVDALRHD